MFSFVVMLEKAVCVSVAEMTSVSVFMLSKCALMIKRNVNLYSKPLYSKTFKI